ncbi:hypothetical protein [Microvirga ossetica]|uniref:hypothetical protein n=1 Tax=Microvirga ossetica TaxID=1882682 RepID=UPI0012FFFE28|nr:hypothetical protein [Microvirga ossetica]
MDDGADILGQQHLAEGSRRLVADPFEGAVVGAGGEEFELDGGGDNGIDMGGRDNEGGHERSL